MKLQQTNPLRLVFTIAWLAILSACSTRQQENTQTTNHEAEDPVAKGRYLVTIGGCNDCHTPKIMTPQGPVEDSSRVLSGHPASQSLPAIDAAALQPGYWVLFAPDLTAAVGPWGASFAANLTPDSATGIGAWSEAVFLKTLRTGKHLGQENGRPILPPMPWPGLAKMKEEDLKAIYAYLRSLPPVRNQVPAPISPQETAKLARKTSTVVSTKAP